MTHRVRVLSSYIYAVDEGPYSAMGRRNRWFHGFVAELIAHGLSLNDFDIEFLQLPQDLGDLERLCRELDEQQVQLVICGGTDAIVRWTRVCDHIPALYFGAHPENNGMEIVRRPGVGGVRLNLPLIWSYDNFSLLRELMPNIRAVYIPLNLQSEFVFPNVRAVFEQFRHGHDRFWIPGTSGWCGHRSVQFLAERLGCEYYEGPYSSVDELIAGLDEANPENAAFVGFNDTVLMKNAANRFRTWCAEHGVALFWVNNWPIVSSDVAGGVADFSSDFERVGRLLARQTLATLREGRTVGEVGFAEDPGQRLGLNLQRCADLHLNVSDSLRMRFQVVKE